MAATRVNPKYKKQWQKLMFSFFDYLPMKYEASPREWQVRKLIWDFKDGKRSLQVAELVARKIRETFGSMTEKIVFCCIPASSSEKNVKRYKEFSDEVCRLAGTVNAFDHISVEGERLAVHEYKGAKSVKGVQVISFEEAFSRVRKYWFLTTWLHGVSLMHVSRALWRLSELLFWEVFS